MKWKPRRLAIECLEDRRMLAGVITQVGYFDTWTGPTNGSGGLIGSSDPSDLAYVPSSGHFILVDANVEETPGIAWNGNNVWEISLAGDQVYQTVFNNWGSNPEPTGITYNAFDGFFYMSNDNKNDIERYDDALDSPLATRKISLDVPNSGDEEDITSDPATGLLYIGDGVGGSMSVLVYDSNLQFQFKFPLAAQMQDVDGIAFEPTLRHLFVGSAPDEKIFEYTLDGTFIDSYDISGFSPSIKHMYGLEFAPTSNPNDDPGELALYIPDRGANNVADGRVFETVIGSVSGNLPPTTNGIADVNVNTDSPDTVLDLFAAFDDFEDPDTDLTYTLENNSNPSLFTATAIDGVLGTLTLDYAASTNGTADITIRATDTGSPALFVETTFSVTVSSVNLPPTTTGIANVFAAEDGSDTVIDLFSAFDDAEDSDSSLTYTVQSNTNTSLFTSTNINGAQGTLTLNYAPDANGTANITVRATDTGFPVQFVETTFTADISEVNDAPVLVAGSVDNLTVVQNSPATPLGLSGLVYGPGGGNDENGQSLSYVVTSVPSSTMGDIVLSDGSTVVTPGVYSLAQIQGMQFRATPNTFGSSDTFSFAVTDNGTTNGIADSKTLFQSLQVDVIEFAPTTFDVRVSASSDDAEEKPSGSVKLTSSDLELTLDGTNQQVVGIRFTGVDLPQGASIQNAYIQFQVDETGSDPTSLAIFAQAIDNAPTFTAVSGNVSTRTTTAASVPWSPAPWTTIGQAGPDQQTSNIGAVVQEIVDRPGWASGNSLAILIMGTGKRTAESFNGDQLGAPLLHVEFLPPNQPPVLAAIGPQFVNEGSLHDFMAAATDMDLPVNNLTFSLDAGAPAGAAIDPTTGQFTWTPSEAEGPGVYSVTVRVTDDGTPSLDDFETFDITVGEVNQAPVLAAIGSRSVAEGSLLTFTAAATDADSPVNSLSFSLDAGAPAGAAIDPISGLFSWTPNEAEGPGVFSVTVRVTDDGTPSRNDLETFDITVGEVNQAPVLAPIGNRSVAEGNLLTFTTVATDIDSPANSLSFSLDAGAPAGAAIDPISGLFSWTPSEADGPGVFSVTVRVTDNGTPSLDDFETFDITVGEVNQAPVLAAIGNRSVAEGSLLTFTAAATDADSPVNSLSFSLDAGAPAGATIDPISGQFSWTPTELDGPGVYSVTVRVTDNGIPSLDDFETLNITVGEINQAPVLAAIGNKSVDEGSLLTFTATATDADLPANTLTFSLDAGAPTGATIDPTTGQFSWTPPIGTLLGSQTVTIRVADDGTPTLEDFETITITVNDVNQAPELATIGNKSVAEGSLLTFMAAATDVDLPANNLSFSLDAGAPTGATIDPTTGLFSWTPSEADGPGVSSVTVRVTDNGTPSLDDFETIDITVGETNQAPVLATIGNKSVDEGSLLTFMATTTDADLPANSLTFSLDAGAPTGAIIDPNTGMFNWVPPGGISPGNHSVTIRVTDNGTPSLDDFETFTITVNDVNLAPVLAAIGNKNVAEGSLLTFTATATDADLPANSLTFSLDPGAPTGAAIDPTSGQFSWTPSEADGPGVYSVTVRVTDDGTPSLDDFETFDITVGEVNQAPVLAAIGDKSVDEDSLLTFTVSATDADLPANTLTFSLDAGSPVGAAIDPTTGLFSWTPSEADGPAVFSVTVRVTDNGTPNLDDFETFNITVGEVNLGPVLAAIGNKSVAEGSLLTFAAIATDPDLPVNSLTFRLDSGAPAGATIDPTTGQFSWTPSELDGPGVYSVTVRVTDSPAISANFDWNSTVGGSDFLMWQRDFGTTSGALSGDGDATGDGKVTGEDLAVWESLFGSGPALYDFETFDITVGEVNQAPVLAAIGDKSVDEGSLLTFTAAATDADLPANSLSFSLDADAPAGATIDPTTGLFNWTPTEADGPGVYSVTVRVTDNGIPSLDDFETLNITVGEINQAPVLAAIGNKSADEGSLLTFMAAATDADLSANSLTFSLDAGAPTGAIIDPSNGMFNWVPPGGTSPGNHTVTIRVTDNGTPNLDDFETITITVNDINLAPVLAAIGNKNIDEGSLLTFMASATDADLPANSLSFSLDTGAPAGAAIDPISGQFSWTPNEADGPGVFSVTVRVTDNGTPNLDDFETFDITVGEVNQAPVLAAIGNKNVAEGSLLSFSAAAIDIDLPVNNLTFSLDAGAPAGATIDPSTGMFNWTPSEADGPGVYSVTVRVTDDGTPSLDDFETINITVGEVNQAPVLAAIGNKSVDEGSLLSFTAAATDADLPANNLIFSLDAASMAAGMTIDPTSGLFSWIPSEAQGPGTYDVTVTATDDGTTNGIADPKTSSQSFQIDVIDFVPTPTTVEVRVAASSDDAEERPSGSVTLTSSDLELTVSGTNQQVVGMRFTGLNIPSGATIQNAYIQFQVDETSSGASSLTIRAQAIDDAPTFTSVSGSISSRATSTASVPWSPVPWTTVGEAGPDQQTSNIAAVVQEIVNRAGWASGNSLAILITGTGERTAESFNGNQLGAPLLHVEYVTGGNQTPTTSGIANVNVNTDAPDTVIDLFAAFDDFEDPDTALTYTIENNTNPSLFTATPVDGVAGTLTLDYAPATTGTADITVRATDTATPALFVETTFAVTVAPENQPPTTTGIADVFEAEDAGNTTIDLFAAFADPEDLDSALTYTVEANTNAALFTSTNISGALGTMDLDYAPDANGSADITVRATDTGFPLLFVETTFTVAVSAVNDTPELTTGSVNDLSVVQNSPAIPLGLAGLSYGPGGDSDENGQTLNYSVTSVPSPTLGDVLLSDGTTVVTPGVYTLTQIQGMQFLAAAGVFGSSGTFSFAVTDNGTTNGSADFKTLNQSLQISVIEDNPVTSTIDVQVSARSDDAEERFSGVVKFVSKDLDLVDDPTQSGVQQTVGIRFNGLTIPQGAVITNAYVQFEASAFDDDPTTLNFHGEDTNNVVTFDTTDFNITSRQVTNATVAWSPVDWTTPGEAGIDQQTPNISSIIQEVVNRAGWVSGNSLALFITGFGERAAVSYDGDVVNGTTGAPRLHVEYTLNQSPLAAISAGSPPPSTQTLGEGELAPIVDEAVLQLSQSESAGVADSLSSTDFAVVALPGSMSGRARAISSQIDVKIKNRSTANEILTPVSSPTSDPIGTELTVGSRKMTDELSGEEVDAFYEMLGLELYGMGLSGDGNA